LRVLAVAEVNDATLDEAAGFEPYRGRLRFLGLLGQMDPPRDEVKAAVEECLVAGIRPVMVTGDHKATGLAIATALGIARPGDIARWTATNSKRCPNQDLRANWIASPSSPACIRRRSCASSKRFSRRNRSWP
jgi:magnesium-transporting ATPase (P-type)